MLISTRNLMRDLLPPLGIRALKSIQNIFGVAPYEFVGYEWVKNIQLRGWDSHTLSEIRENAWPKFLCSLEGTHPFGIQGDELLSLRHIKTEIQSLYLSFGYCLGLACHGRQTISLLDWVGATGNYYAICRTMMPDVNFNYHCVELPSICEIGRELLPDDESWNRERFDFVFSSSSLQYLENWRPTVGALADSAEQYLYYTRMPFVLKGKSFVMLPRAKEYSTEYLGWCLNRDEFVQFVEKKGLRLRREFVCHPGPLIHKAPQQNIYMGFLFERSPNCCSGAMP